MKRLLIFAGGAALLLLVLLEAVSASEPDASFSEAGSLIAMRQVGHELLRYTGDSTTPVPPVVEPSRGTYLISFSKAFSFKPDSLVAVIDRVLVTARPGADYIVNVLEAPSNNIVYGYANFPTDKQQIVPCNGRSQAVGTYAVRIRFREKEARNRWLLAGVGVLLLGGVAVAVATRRRGVDAPLKQEGPSIEQRVQPSAAGIAIGRFLFRPGQHCLILNNEQIALTGKETQLLHVFAAHPNEVIDRARLQKIWDDEGVIVGRSLDVFVSRLRKKLEGDAAIRLVNIHGKGYKLEVEVKI